MRLVFAGTPEPALPALEAVAASRHELVGVVTRPDAPAGRGRRLVASPVAQRAEELGVPVLKPEHPRDPDFQAALRDARPGLLPGGGLRRAAAAERARHPAARLGQPALLAAARLAGRRPGAARAVGRRRGHRRHHLPDRPGARRRPDLRRDDRAGPARPTPPATCSAGSPRAAPSCWCATLDGIEDGALEAREQPAEGVSLRPRSGRGRRGGLDRAGRRASTGGSGPARPRPVPGRRTTGSGSSSARCDLEPDREPLAPGVLEVTKNAVLRRHRHRRRCGSARSRPSGKQADARPPTGPAACGSSPARRSGDATRRERRPQRGRAARARADPARAAAYDVLRAVRDKDAYTNLVLPPLLRGPRPDRPRRRLRHRAGLRHHPPAGHLRRGDRRATSTGRWPRSTRRCSTRCGWAPTSCSRMRVPSHAAVGTTVDLVRAKVGQRPAGFVNAVLRKVAGARPRPAGCAGSRPDPGDRPGRLRLGRATRTRAGSSRRSPRRSATDAGELDDLLAADNAPPKVTLVARPGLATVEELVAAGGTASTLVAVRRALAGGDPGAIARGRRGPRRRPGRGLPAGRAGAAPARRSRAATSAGSTCAPAPAARPRCSPALAGGRGARLLAAERQPHRAALVAGGDRAGRAPGCSAW